MSTRVVVARGRFTEEQLKYRKYNNLHEMPHQPQVTREELHRLYFLRCDRLNRFRVSKSQMAQNLGMETLRVAALHRELMKLGIIKRLSSDPTCNTFLMLMKPNDVLGQPPVKIDKVRPSKPAWG